MDFSQNQALLTAQRNEVTEHYVYKNLARRQKDPQNRALLERIAEDELRHAKLWAELTGVHLGPRHAAVLRYRLMARIFGLTFAVKLMERGEADAQANYGVLAAYVPEAEGVAEDEDKHEQQLLGMLDEERLRYVGSVVLGLTDALVELTGALAGFTLALANTQLIAMVGMITGIAAAMSMAASEYLSTKAEEGHDRTPVKAAVYTGSTYLLTVILLIVPYLLASHALVALGITLSIAMVLVLCFTYYMAVTKDLPFWGRFGEMAGLTLGVATASFFIGYGVRVFFGIDV